MKLIRLKMFIYCLLFLSLITKVKADDLATLNELQDSVENCEDVTKELQSLILYVQEYTTTESSTDSKTTTAKVSTTTTTKNDFTSSVSTNIKEDFTTLDSISTTEDFSTSKSSSTTEEPTTLESSITTEEPTTLESSSTTEEPTTLESSSTTEESTTKESSSTEEDTTTKPPAGPFQRASSSWETDVNGVLDEIDQILSEIQDNPYVGDLSSDLDGQTDLLAGLVEEGRSNPMMVATSDHLDLLETHTSYTLDYLESTDDFLSEEIYKIENEDDGESDVRAGLISLVCILVVGAVAGVVLAFFKPWQKYCKKERSLSQRESFSSSVKGYF